MQIWLDVFDAAGNRLGDGPVIAVRDADGRVIVEPEKPEAEAENDNDENQEG